jgi:hypothetical protein
MRNNWGVTTNCGLMVAAISFYEFAPTNATTLLRYATGGFAYTMQAWGPDGAWAEGNTYLSMTGHYGALGIAILQNALGSDQGILAYIGNALSGTGYWRRQMVAPSLVAFNFADDATGNPLSSPVSFFVSSRYAQPEVYQAEFNLGGTASPRTPKTIAFGWSQATATPTNSIPLEAKVSGGSGGKITPQIDTAFFRTSFTDSKAAWVRNIHFMPVSHIAWRCRQC